MTDPATATVPRTSSATCPSVSVILPVLDEEEHIDRCLAAVARQSYGQIVEVLVADGGSVDATRKRAEEYPLVRVLDNPRRIRPAGLNVAIGAATGQVIVRVDARTELSPDYVARCVEALHKSGAAIVGGPMSFEASSPKERGIVAAMTSKLGAGPASFRRVTGEARFVDTVYLGAFHSSTVRALGGYDEWSGGNEDAELAYRAQQAGGVYLDPEICSEYLVREGLRPLARQFYRYGFNRARTVRKHPRALSPRQLAVPGLFLGLISPWRRPVLVTYGFVVAARALVELPEGKEVAATFAAALPTMHAAWGVGFLRGLTSGGGVAS